jgi:hypothetical protein
MATFGARVTPASRVLFRELAGEAVLLELNSGQYYGLNEIGTRIWLLLQQHSRIDSVYCSLLKEYAVPADRLRDDLLLFVDRLAGKGLVNLHED